MAAQAFSYRRSVAPMMWVMVALASIELVVTHLLLAFWWPRMALAVSIATLAGLVWLVRGIASFERLPVLVEADRVVLRAGTLFALDVPRTAIARIEAEPDCAAVKASGVRNLALIAHPNVLVHFDPPLPGRRRPARGVAMRLDDAPGFIAAVTSR